MTDPTTTTAPAVVCDRCGAASCEECAPGCAFLLGDDRHGEDDE